MGLDAVVYRNRNHMKLGQDDQRCLVAETGEICFDSPELQRKHQDQSEACRHRFGNAAEISALREAATHVLGEKSLLATAVLYSASHSGDIIVTKLLARLEAEVNLLMAHSGATAPLRVFGEKLRELIQAALAEGNPIVFV